MARVYVARHGETDWNRAGRYQGQRESELTPLGERQAAALAGALASSAARRAIASPLRRCTLTAQPVAAQLGIDLETDERLLEIAHGTWEGRLRDEIERTESARMRAWRQAPESVVFPGGESLASVAARWDDFARSLTGRDDVVVVTHDVLVRLAILAATTASLADFWKPRVCNGGYAVFGIGAGGWQLLEECHDDHLAGIATDPSRQAL